MTAQIYNPKVDKTYRVTVGQESHVARVIDIDGEFIIIELVEPPSRFMKEEFTDRTGLSLDWNMDGAVGSARELLNYLKAPDQIDTRLDRQRQELLDMLESIDKIRKPE